MVTDSDAVALSDQRRHPRISLILKIAYPSRDSFLADYAYNATSSPPGQDSKAHAKPDSLIRGHNPLEFRALPLPPGLATADQIPDMGSVPETRLGHRPSGQNQGRRSFSSARRVV